MERVKRTMDTNFTMKNLLQEFFVPGNVKEEFKDLGKIHDTVLPKLTCENYRIYFMRNFCDKMSPDMYNNFYRRCISKWYFTQRYEYCAGYIVIVDYRDANLKEVIANVNLVQFKAIAALWIDGFGLILKGIHVLTSSRMIDMLVSILKQVLKPKIADRIHIHTNLESLYKFVSKDLLPQEYGGKETTLSEMHERWLDLLSTEDHIKYMKTIRVMKTDESKRSVGRFNEEYFGTPGTFRTLVLD